jgi:hypothetical protein
MFSTNNSAIRLCRALRSLALRLHDALIGESWPPQLTFIDMYLIITNSPHRAS